ncbi:MAG TPA: MarR family transcriptional regulator [Anaerolineaceae bacterium]|nr:MarR family transcriptional regulator [Anaerolineaceae bacterium]
MEEKTRQLAEDLLRTLIQFNRMNIHRSLVGGLKRSEFIFLSTLTHLVQSGAKGVKVSSLSNQMEVTPAAVTHILNAMEETGYVERIADPADRRIVLIRPTETGEELMTTAKSRLFAALEGLVEYLGEEDSQELIRLLAVTMDYYRERVE